MKRSQTIFTAFCLIVIYLLSVWVRVGIRKAAEAKEGEIPFTMESAFLYYFSNSLAHGKPIPLIDFKAQNPEGFKAAEKISLTPDHVLGFVYRHAFKKIPYTLFLRMAQPVFLCLSVFLIFGIVYASSKNSLGGIWASLIYGLSVSSVLRSTGIEYSRENFALPFLFLHFALMLSFKEPSSKDLFSKEKTQRGIYMTLFGRTPLYISIFLKNILAALALALALMIWDGSQVYFILWVMFEILRFLFQKSEIRSDVSVGAPRIRTASGRNPQSAIFLLVLIPAALIHPYLRDHQFLYSPGMMGLYGLFVTIPFRKGKILLVLFIPILFFLWIQSPYLEIYGHMLQLMLYKIKFLNIKPPDPSLLPFDVRLLWTPALHSTPFQNLKNILPLVLLSIPAAWTLWKAQKGHAFFLLFFSLSSLILSLAFVRLEVYLVFFLACLIGSLPFGLNPQRKRQRLFWNSLVFLALLIEAENITKDFSRFERPVLYPHLETAVRWIKEDTPRDAIVLANFGLSPSILAYGHRGIVLHPKYESRDMREKIREFAFKLFETLEEPFYQYCLQNEASYYVHALGTFQDRSHFSWRYMVNQLEAREQTLAERFEYGIGLKRFYPVYDNAKYRVYRIIRPAELARERALKREGDALLGKGSWKEAEGKYLAALRLNPNDFMIYFRLAKLYRGAGQPEKAIQATKEGLRKNRGKL